MGYMIESYALLWDIFCFILKMCIFKYTRHIWDNHTKTVVKLTFNNKLIIV